METVLIVIHLMVVLALVGVVLLQRSEGGGLGIGGGSGFMTARGAANALTRATAILAAAFFVTSLTCRSWPATASSRSTSSTACRDRTAPARACSTSLAARPRRRRRRQHRADAAVRQRCRHGASGNGSAPPPRRRPATPPRPINAAGTNGAPAGHAAGPEPVVDCASRCRDLWSFEHSRGKCCTITRFDAQRGLRLRLSAYCL